MKGSLSVNRTGAETTTFTVIRRSSQKLSSLIHFLLRKMMSTATMSLPHLPGVQVTQDAGNYMAAEEEVTRTRCILGIRAAYFTVFRRSARRTSGCMALADPTTLASRITRLLLPPCHQGTSCSSCPHGQGFRRMAPAFFPNWVRVTSPVRRPIPMQPGGTLDPTSVHSVSASIPTCAS